MWCIMDKKNSFRKSIFLKLVLTYITTLIPILIIGYSIYSWGFKLTYNQTIDSMKSHVNLFMGNIENDIQGVRRLQYDIFDDINLNDLTVRWSFLTTYERQLNQLNIQQRIKPIKSSSRYITQIKLFLPELGKSIIGSTLEDMDSDQMSMIKKSKGQLGSGLCIWAGKMLLNATYPYFTDPNDKLPLYFIEIDLSSDELKKTLNELDESSEGGSFLYLDKYDFSISDNTDNELLKIIKKSININQNNSFSINYKGINYFIAYSRSSQLGISLIKYVPMSHIFEKIDKYRILFCRRANQPSSRSSDPAGRWPPAVA